MNTPPQYPPPPGPPHGQTPQPPMGYGPPPPGGYAPYGYPMSPHRTTSTAAIVSFACGIAGWLFVPVIAPIVAVVFGHIALREIRAAPGRLDGEGFAIAGLILGYIQIILAALAVLVFVVIFSILAGVSSR